MMIYRNPDEVRSPRNMVSAINVIHDGGNSESENLVPISIAEVTWGGTKQLAVRSNISHAEWRNQHKLDEQIDCKGNPSSRGYPTWFILPKKGTDAWKILKRAMLDFEQEQ